ncbi:MAG: alanine racemase [Bacillota bacterium]|nr:alanine racemase [Bacillota bacterium]
MNIQTPAVVVDLEKLEKNIYKMQQFADKHNIKLRPHIKAHKTLEIAKMQLDAGAKGITVAKLGEAEEMAEAAEDILVAYQLVGASKIQRLLSLNKIKFITVAVDHLSQATALNSLAQEASQMVSIYLEVDTGLNRCGLPRGADVVQLAKGIRGLSNLRLKGIFTHAGHVYAAKKEDVPAIGQFEGEELVRVAKDLAKAGIIIEEVSVGSTPTAFYAGQVTGVTEIRPGNYVFNDAIQLGLGVCQEEDCALSVKTTVISTPSSDRCVIDAGSKVFGLDQGAHGAATVKGFGLVKGWPQLVISRLSEEHGVITVDTKLGPSPSIGEVLEVIPNHACQVINLADYVYVVKENNPIFCWKVAARGKVV